MTVLNAYSDYIVPDWFFILACLALAGYCVILFLTVTHNPYSHESTVYSIVAVILLILFICTTCGVFHFPSWKHTRQDVVLDDSYSYNDFTSKYKVIETKGKILTVEEID